MISGANGISMQGLRPGQMIGAKYQVVGKIGEGGMGTVYEVTHVSAGRQCALKMLHPAFNVGDIAKRFHREIQLGVKLRHDNIVDIFDYGTNTKDNVPYFVMEMLTGEDLGTRLRRGGIMTFDEAYPILTQVIDALSFAHGEDVVHRDLKPDNIFLCSSSAVKILDFGIAKITNEAAKIDTLVTQDVAVLGTPHYMSPEQALGLSGQVDERTDVFALGAIIYQMLSGKLAFTGNSSNEVIVNIAAGKKPKDIRELAPNLPAGMHTFIEKALAENPNDRFQSMPEMGAALKDIHEGKHAKAKQAARPATNKKPARDMRFRHIALAGSASRVLTAREAEDVAAFAAVRRRRTRWLVTLGFLAATSGIGAAYYFDAPHVRSTIDSVIQTLLGKNE